MAFENLNTSNYPDIAIEPVAALVVDTLATNERFAKTTPSKNAPRFSSGEIIKGLTTTRKDREHYALQADTLRQRLPLMPLTDEQKKILAAEYTKVTALLLAVE